ncbi:MAG TPA: LacI family DNA-binding transcriptional regulator [Candidatus Methylacidiphilales bacterium]|nr:LacI family DNA-binding transcriptional regulator [Candidatus Methylacidiphilales bacterium]
MSDYLISVRPDETPCTLALVAKQARVSPMTVSRVFRNFPCVSTETRERVLAVAKTLGYRPDPQVMRLMQLVRRNRTRKISSRLAVIRAGGLQDDVVILGRDVAKSPVMYNYMALGDIRRRALQHGYDVDEFEMGAGTGMTPQRLREILDARGIRGILVSVQSMTGELSQCSSSHFDYTGLAAATFGYGLNAPRLHRASTNMTQGILETAALLELRGYQRIGLAISSWVDTRADHTYSGAWLHYQQTVPLRRRIPLQLFPDNNMNEGEQIFCRWIRKYNPDLIISFDRLVPHWLRETLQLRIPDDIGIVVHDWTSGATAVDNSVNHSFSFAGIDHRRSHVAAAAVDLVATQLQHNEHGIPEVPRQILIPPTFVDGSSIRGPFRRA